MKKCAQKEEGGVREKRTMHAQHIRRRDTRAHQEKGQQHTRKQSEAALT